MCLHVAANMITFCALGNLGRRLQLLREGLRLRLPPLLLQRCHARPHVPAAGARRPTGGAEAEDHAGPGQGSQLPQEGMPGGKRGGGLLQVGNKEGLGITWN